MAQSIQETVQKADAMAREWELYRSIQQEYFREPTTHMLQKLRIAGQKMEDAANAYKGYRNKK